MNAIYAATFLLLIISSVASSTNKNVETTNVPSPERKQRPNFVVFLVDDLGIADIGCFGNDTIKTPNIDRLASLGAKLTHNLAPASLCTPSRAATLTGRYAVRSGLAAGSNEAPVLFNLGAPGGLPPNETTVGKVLQQAGYRTSLVGKWHVGLNCNDNKDGCHHPINMGFHEFYGLPLSNLRDCGPRKEGSTIMPYLERFLSKILIASLGLVLTLAYFKILSKRRSVILGIIVVFWMLCILVLANLLIYRFNCLLMRGFDVVEQPFVLENMTVKFTNEAKQFVQKNKENPFFLFMSFAKVHVPLFTSSKFKGHSVHGRYGDNVEEMDWSVGEILSTLEKDNILDNTFIYFTSDHGPYIGISVGIGEDLGGCKGNYRGGKGQTWEGGIRVPTVATWKGHIPPGIVINEPTNSMDIFTTLIELAGANVPNDRIIDGKNILPLLTTEQTISPHEFMFHYCGDVIHAVRYRAREGHVTWKAHFVTPKWSPGREDCYPEPLCGCFGKTVNVHDPPLLYDITNDPYEKQSLDTTKYQDMIQKMTEAMKEHEQGVKPVPRQLGYPNAWWSPRLQPCCNFPFCSCRESD